LEPSLKLSNSRACRISCQIGRRFDKSANETYNKKMNSTAVMDVILFLSNSFSVSFIKGVFCCSLSYNSEMRKGNLNSLYLKVYCVSHSCYTYYHISRRLTFIDALILGYIVLQLY
jgi:hypothetical protein